MRTDVSPSAVDAVDPLKMHLPSPVQKVRRGHCEADVNHAPQT